MICRSQKRLFYATKKGVSDLETSNGGVIGKIPLLCHLYPKLAKKVGVMPLNMAVSPYFTAMHSTSTRAFLGSVFTATAERAG